LLAVSASDPIERPWNAPKNAMTLCRPVTNLASFSAASFASVPELLKNDRCGPGIGAMADISSPSRACSS
jgi:hypothetical protein